MRTPPGLTAASCHPHPCASQPPHRLPCSLPGHPQHSLRSPGLASHAHKLTVGITVVGVGDTAESLLASCVPDLQRQAQDSGLPVPSPHLPTPTPTPHLSPAASPSCHPHPELCSETQPASSTQPSSQRRSRQQLGTVLPPGGGGAPEGKARPELGLRLSAPGMPPNSLLSCP